MPQSQWILEQVVFGGVVYLDEGLTTIGRNHRSTIVASSDYVSRNHAQIRISPDNNEIHIRDLGSKNGIYVNEFQYCNAECTLTVGDRIGIGVAVDDTMVSSFAEGVYPIYLLKRLPEKQINQCENPKNTDELNKEDEIDDNERDRVNENENFVMPQPSSVGENVVDNVADSVAFAKKEPDPPTTSSSSIISENIKSIFGYLNPELLSTLSEETRKVAESSTRVKEPIASEDVICISSSEEEDCDAADKRQKKVISPELFDDSIISDKCNTNSVNKSVMHPDCSSVPIDTNKQTNNINQNAAEVQKPQKNNTPVAAKDNHPISAELRQPKENGHPIADEVEQQPEKTRTAVENDKITENNNQPTEPDLNDLKDEFDDDNEDLFFTQKIFEDMKEYAADLAASEDTPDFKIEPEDLDSIPIKQEIYPENLDGTIINLDDEDDYDEALESKVHNWSVKLCSQSFSNSFNASQVFEDNYSDEEVEDAPRTKTIFIDDDDDEMDFVDKAAMVEVKTEPEIDDTTGKTPFRSERDVRSLQKALFLTSEEDEDKHDGPSTSFAALKKFHGRLIRRLSTSEEIPNKKARLSSRSEDNEKEHVRSSSSSHRTYSRKNAGSKHSHSSHGHKDSSPKEDLFDKLKENDKSKRNRKSSSSSSSHKSSIEHKKTKDDTSNVHRRTSPGADQTATTVYKSATVARMKSVGSNTCIDHNDADDFVDVKKGKAEPTNKSKESKRPEPQAPVTTISKIIRGPPEIIQPPQLPLNKGKLRGVSAAQKRIAEKLKASSNSNELKRKWLEKPSAKKDKEKAKAIQEDRKKKLRELNDKKQSDNINSSPNKVPAKETVAEEKEGSRKNLKVKVTQNNRGAFLTELPTINPKPHYTIPKKLPKSNGSSARMSNGSSKSSPRISPAKIAQKNPPQQQRPKAEITNSFAKELAQVDIVLQRQTSRERVRSTDASNEPRQCAPPRQNSKKITFTSMQQQFDENERVLASGRIKKVTFKLPPEIHYFVSISSAKPKRQQKESSKFLERKTFIRERYLVVDKTDNLLDDILSWSQLWLGNKHHNVDKMVFPMNNQFLSFDEYKSIALPLLKMEYLEDLEKGLKQYASKPIIVAEIDYSAPHKHRDYLFAKCNTPIKQSELSFNDLALIEIAMGSTTSQYFGYISNIRKSGTCTCITVEITANAISKEILKTKPKIKIRRIIDGILLHLSTFNAVHQLEHTPLTQKILNPIELLSTTNNIRTSSIEYKGFNVLNKEQLDILLKTYEKAIDQSNPSVSLINGPPGTGKSVLISNLAIQLLYGNEVNELDKKILICAQSNMAVDVIAEKLIKIKQRLSPETAKFTVVRVGVEEKVHQNVRGITLKSILQRHRMSILHKQANQLNQQAVNEENLNLEIVHLEARIAEMEKQKFQDVRQEELIEMRRNLALKKNILNQVFRPEDEKRLNKWFIENANIVCSTLSGCAKLASFVDYFDVCIIDEATQCTEPWALMPLRFGVSSLIMVGDTQQLPATVISQRAKELGLEKSLFTRIKNCLENNYRETSTPQDIQNKPIFTLHEQYRMNSEISKWPNMYFYKNQLRNNPKTDEFKSSIKPFSILNLEYRQNDTYHGQISISNNLEAEFVAKLVTTLDNYIPNKFYSYGVITPYAQHREKLEKIIKNSGLKDIMVNTIDSYQGIEKDVIIISNARTHGVGFLGNYQRLNVALTRPRKCLIVCGNFRNLESVPSWASLLANAKERGLYHNISTTDALDITKNVIEKIKIKR